MLLLVRCLHRHHDVRGFGRQQFVQLGLEQQAGLPVKRDDLPLETVGFHLGMEVLDDVLADLTDALGRLDQHCHLGGIFREVVLVQVRQTAGQVLVGSVQRRLVDMKVDQARLEMQLQRGTVADRLLEAVPAHVAFLVLVGTKGVEGVAVGTVDRRTGQAEQKRVGQGLTHLAAQVAFLRAVGFVHQGDDVAAVVQAACGLAELEDRGDDDLAHVLRQQLLQLLAGIRLFQVGNVRSGEGTGDLTIKIDPIHHDQHGGILQAGMHAQLLRGKDHQQRFARTLEVPDQALPGIARQHALDDLVGRFKLLVAADDLDALLFLVGGEQGEAAEDVQHHMWAQHAFSGQFERLQRVVLTIVTVAIQIPRPPILNRQADGPVVVSLAFGRHREHVADEELRHELLVVVVHLHRAIDPTDALLDRRLGLDQYQRQTIHQQHQIGAALGGACAVDVLLGDDVLVLRQVIQVDQPHRHMLVVVAEGHRALTAHPRSHLLVGADQPIRAHRQHDGAQLVEHLVGAVGLSGNLRVQPNQRLTQPGLDQHFLNLARHLSRGGVAPADAFGAGAVAGLRFLGGVGRDSLDWAGEQIADIGFDGVGFVKHYAAPPIVLMAMSFVSCRAASQRAFCVAIAFLNC